MKNFDHFNIISPIYDLVFGRRIDQEIVELLNLEPYHSLLDVGGGTGRVSALLKDTSENLVVADSARKMLQQAKIKNLDCIQSHSEKQPFTDESFDRVIIVDAFHHVLNQKQTLGEMWRVLKAGGRMVIEEPDIKNFYVKLIAIGEKLLFMRSRFRSPQKILDMCQFRDVASREVYRKDGIAWIMITKQSEL
jgi:demethylmenaquinone methyltransferase/2-methoxy-6-polyprenyl-1,4-benzoquinol methylase